MDTVLDKVVKYTLDINDFSHNMNDYLGSFISIKWNGFVICQCGK